MHYAQVEPPAGAVGAIWILLGWLARIATFCLVGAIIALGIMLLVAWHREEDIRVWRRLIVICLCCLILASTGSIVSALF